MHTISRDSPCYYLTSVAKDRLPVFRTDEIKLTGEPVRIVGVPDGSLSRADRIVPSRLPATSLTERSGRANLLFRKFIRVDFGYMDAARQND